jgi:hypothetical protein
MPSGLDGEIPSGKISSHLLSGVSRLSGGVKLPGVSTLQQRSEKAMRWANFGGRPIPTGQKHDGTGPVTIDRVFRKQSCLLAVCIRGLACRRATGIDIRESMNVAHPAARRQMESASLSGGGGSRRRPVGLRVRPGWQHEARRGPVRSTRAAPTSLD